MEQEINKDKELETNEPLDVAEEQTAQSDNHEEEETAQTTESVQTPEERILELEQQVEELKRQQLYKVAEFDNFRKRVMQEKAELIKNGGSKVISTLLPVIDDLERAQENMDKYEDVESLRQGLELIIEKFFKLLAQEGLVKMDVVGQTFDPDYHEAIAMVPGLDEAQKGKIIDCMTAGYILNEKVIRYAKVAVAE